MPTRKLFVLDVGHGNCTLLQDDNGIVVIDAGPKTGLHDFLRIEGLNNLDVVLLSHSDEDHIAGLISILEDEKIEVGIVRVNPDGSKQSDIWDDLLFVLENLRKKHTVDFKPTLTTADNGLFNQGKVNIQILAPNPYIAGKAPGSKDRKGRKLTSNSNSVVIRLISDGVPIALIPGDIDSVGFENLLEDEVECHAPIVIFPHHGGNSGRGKLQTFVEKFCENTNPRIIIFSIDRILHNNPKPDLINLVRQQLPLARIACTQLSQNCALELPSAIPPHLTNRYAKGKPTKKKSANKCCAGTIEINLEEPLMGLEKLILPELDLHRSFVKSFVSNSLCLK